MFRNQHLILERLWVFCYDMSNVLGIKKRRGGLLMGYRWDVKFFDPGKISDEQLKALRQIEQ